MARFNKPTSTKTINLAGGVGFSQSPKHELINILLTSFVSDKFYRSASDEMNKLIQLIEINDKKFVAQAGVYARTQIGMRSITHILAGEIANKVKGEQWTKGFFDKIIYRPDDMTEILSYYLSTYGKPVPNSLKKGFSAALQRFNDYQLSKYRSSKSKVKLVDVVNLVHPRGNDTLKSLVDDSLRSTETWESQLSASKGDDVAKKQVWHDLISERKLGYFALLRNLRNIMHQSPQILDQALEQLTDEALIKNSLVMPFRFNTALTQIEQESGSRKVVQALSIALEKSLSNVPKLPGETLVVLDVSGSMQGQPIEIGSLFASVLYKANNADLMVFSDEAQYVTANPMDSTLSIAKHLRNVFSGGTDFNSIFAEANKSYERIIILSDMQGWVGYHTPMASFNEYKTRTGSNPTIYSFDLQGYGTLEFPENGIYQLYGFSDKVFDIMKLLESDKNALIKKIQQIEL